MSIVKPLTWATNGSTSLWTGELIFDVYYILYDDGNGWWAFRGRFLSDSDDTEVGYAADVDTAKALAQTNYESVVGRALDPAHLDRVKQLEDALRPFATVALELPDIVLNDDLVVIETFKIQVPASAFYTARALLNGGSNERS